MISYGPKMALKKGVKRRVSTVCKYTNIEEKTQKFLLFSLFLVYKTVWLAYAINATNLILIQIFLYVLIVDTIKIGSVGIKDL